MSPMHENAHTAAPFFRRLFASGLCALVLAVGMLAASPQLHKMLHNDADQPDHTCVITDFAQGATLTAALDVPPANVIVWREVFFTAPEAPLFGIPKHTHPLQCGPPARV
ncbi:hypothetical protein M2103_000058 [Ereboglobus sp. PH5-5]|uniref:hypothetical protein n=1 Tax=Ereboglobus sp. PH5-5 TaxID=2940529 RepID=UPI0024052920|nr:hypothetical protein [Ereboglobus sp. PH5-5]MDF9831854.1 hypothetical protein [Ereboglobus sp. PH5-5]